MSALAPLREQALRLLRQAGWAGALGLALLLSAFVLDAASAAVDAERRAALAAERARLLQGVVSAEAAQRGGPAHVGDFYTAFPPLQTLPRALARLADLADSHGVNVDRTDYRSADQAGTPLVRVALSLPVQGRFSAVHGWLGEVLATMPEVALESLVVRRAHPGAELVEGELRLLVFARRAP